MNTTFRLLNLVDLKLQSERAPNGRINITKAFAIFLARPGEPHLSFFADPNPDLGGRLTPHFTAPRFRRELAKITPTNFRAWFHNFELACAKRFAEQLHPADLQALVQDGWQAHYIDRRVVSRWVRMASRSKQSVGATRQLVHARLHLDQQFFVSLGRHILRHHVSPASLAGLVDGGRWLCLRRASSGALDARVLVHFPDGCGADLEDGQGPRLLREPGWYWHELSFMPEEELRKLLPVAKFKQVFEKVTGWLRRYPRASVQEDIPVQEGEEARLCQLGEYFGTDVLLRSGLGRDIDGSQG